LALKVLRNMPNLIEKVVLVSPAIEFRSIKSRIFMPVLSYLPNFISKYLGSIPKSYVSAEHSKNDLRYTVNLLCILSQLRREIIRSEINFKGPSLLIQSSFDHHINPYSL